MGKVYLEKNVYEASQERMDVIFSKFDKICLAFSGGKDSSVMLNLGIEYAKKYNRKIGVMIVDLEGQYKITMEHVQSMLDENKEVIDAYWICLPINLRNAVSVYQPFWCAWEPGLEEKWVRPIPDHHSVISDQNFFPFYKYRMEFEEFVPEFNKWYGKGEKTAMLVGIRSDESLNRFRTIKSTSKKTYNGYKWTTRLTGSNVYNCYPIYDWRTEDIWSKDMPAIWR
jgi:predicted phosphoadenosine phosphosulfate sulfurtransferase